MCLQGFIVVLYYIIRKQTEKNMRADWLKIVFLQLDRNKELA